MMCVFHQSSSSFFSEFLNGFLDLPINQSCPLSYSDLVTLNYICAYAYPVKLASFTKYKKCFKLLINNQAMNLPLITKKRHYKKKNLGRPILLITCENGICFPVGVSFLLKSKHRHLPLISFEMYDLNYCCI